MLTRVTRVVYFVLGILYVLIGAGSMLIPAGWFPQRLADRLLAGEILNPFGQHLLQEFGTVVLALGFVFLWYSRREKLSRTFHWAMTLYVSLDALIHWVGPQGIIGSLSRGIINSIPFGILLVLGLIEIRSTQPTSSVDGSLPR